MTLIIMNLEEQKNNLASLTRRTKCLLFVTLNMSNHVFRWLLENFVHDGLGSSNLLRMIEPMVWTTILWLWLSNPRKIIK